MIDRKPKISIICVTTECNSRCSYCDIWSHHGSNASAKIITAAIDSSNDLGVTLVGFTGGEPLLNNDLERYIMYAKSKIPWVTVSTNGTLLSKERITALDDSGLDALIISLDTLRPDGYEKFRGIGIEHVLRGIEYASNIVKHTRLVISCVISPTNLNDLPDLARFCIERNLMFGLTPLHGSIKETKAEEISFAKEYSEVRKIMGELRSLEELGLRFANTSSYIEALSDFLYTGHLPFASQCPNPYRSISVSNEGFVRICPSMSPIGCLQENNIITIWNSSAKMDVVERMKRHDCRGCWYSYRADNFEDVLVNMF